MILLDTHILYWMANDSQRLSRRARQSIIEARQKTGLAIATITLWELAWMAHNGRMLVSGSVESFIRDMVARVILRPLTPEIAFQGVRLPEQFPKDPSDRIIAATAMVEGMALVTADTRIRKAGVVDTIW